jgi:adenylate cyclase
MNEGGVLPGRSAALGVLVACGVFFALAVVVVARRGALTSSTYLLGLACVWLLVAYALVAGRYEFSLVAPLAGVLTLLVTLVPLEWWQAQSQSRGLRQALGRYVAPAVLNELTRSGNFGVLAPRRQRVTVLVADMADYTRQTSNVPLEEMVELTKEFLDCITKPVLASGGTLDKYTGDGLLAFWGAPLPCDDSADQAVGAALEVLRDLAALNERRAARGLSRLRMRIGIESGEAVVGEMGTRFRTAYTAIGECVNHASRLEAGAAEFGLPLLVGPTAAGLVRGRALKRAGSLAIRGTDAAIDVYTCEAE